MLAYYRTEVGQNSAQSVRVSASYAVNISVVSILSWIMPDHIMIVLRTCRTPSFYSGCRASLRGWSRRHAGDFWRLSLGCSWATTSNRKTERGRTTRTHARSSARHPHTQRPQHPRPQSRRRLPSSQMDAYDEKSQSYLANKRQFNDFITNEVSGQQHQQHQVHAAREPVLGARVARAGVRGRPRCPADLPSSSSRSARFCLLARSSCRWMASTSVASR
jgi:hypothetical protein